MKIGSTQIADTFAEAFDMSYVRLVVTAHDIAWLEAAVQEVTGFASSVIACDLDPDALAATAANAVLNGVEVALSNDLEACLADADCISAADILYDRDNLPLLERFHASGLPILLADSRIPDLDPPGLTLLGTWQASTWPDLGEAGEYNRVRIFASEP